MPVGLGAIGLGGLGQIELDIYAEIEGVEIVAGADVSRQAREIFESEFGAPAYEDHAELLDAHADDLDAITIVTPHTLHYEQAMACLREDVHVFLEKPMVTSIEDAVDLVETANERDLVVQVGYQRHFHPAFVEMKRVIDSGRIGEIHAMDSHIAQDWVSVHQDTWRLDPELSGGGQLYDTGSHLLDALLWVTESTPKSVGAQMDFFEEHVDVNSALSLTLEGHRRTSVASITISGDGIAITPNEGHFFWGTKGSISYVDGTLEVTEKGAVTYRSEITEGTDFHHLTRLKLANFVDSVRGDAEPAVPGEVGLQVTALTESAYVSAETDRIVDVQAAIERAREERGTSE